MADLRDLVPDDPRESGRWRVPGPSPEPERDEEWEDDDSPEILRGPGRFRRFVLRPLVWGLVALVLLVVAVQLAVDTPPARSWLRARLVEEIATRTDRAVRLDAVAVDLLPFVLELRGLEIGGGPGAEGPFLVLPYARLEAEPGTLRHRRLDLRLVRLERPEIDLRFYPEGGDNLVRARDLRRDPPDAPEDGDAGESFEIWIGQLEIDKGQLLLDHDRVPLGVRAEALRARLRGFGEARLQGEIAARGVRVELPEARPIEVDVAATATFEPGLVIVEEGRVSHRLGTGTTEGFCEWGGGRATRQCRFETRGETRGEMLAELGYFRDLAGAFRFDGALEWRPESLGWSGRVDADRLDLWNRRLDDVTGQLLADRYRLRLGLERARYAGGVLSGEVVAEPKAPGRPITADLDVEAVRLDDLLVDQEIPVDGLAARVDAEVLYTFPLGEARRGDGFAEVSLHADSENAEATGGLPIEGAFPLRIRRGVIQAEAAALSSAHQSLLAGGEYDLATRAGRFRYEIETADVGELVRLLPLDGPPPPWLPTAGEGRLEGALDLVRGSLATSLRVALEDAVTPKTRAPEMFGVLDVTTRAVEDLRLDLVDRHRRLSIRGRLPFADPGDGDLDDSGANDPIDLVLVADHWPMAQVQPWLEDTPARLPVDGEVTGRLELRLVEATGEDGEPRIETSGVLAATLEPARANLVGRALELDGVVAELEWDAEDLRVDRLRVLSPAGALAGGGRIDFVRGTLDLRLESERLDLAAPPIATFLPRDDLGAVVSVEARLGGRLDDPDLVITAHAERLTIAGREVAGGASRFEARWHERALELDARLVDAASVHGGGPLAERLADLTFDVSVEDLGDLVRLGGVDPVEGLGGSLDGRLRITGTAGPTGPLDAAFELRSLHLDLPGGRLENAAPATLALDPDGFRIDGLDLRDELGGGVRLDGRAGWGEGEALDLTFDAEIDLAWLAPFSPLPVRGRFDLEGRLGGRVGAPRLEGEGRLREGAVEVPGLRRSFEDLEGEIRLADGVARIDELAGRFAGGRTRLAGEIGLGPALGGPTDYRLELEGRRLALRYLEGFAIAGDVDLVLRGVDEDDPAVDHGVRHRLGGRLELSRLEYVEELRFDLVQLLQGFLRGQRLDVASADDALSTIGLELQIRAPGAVRMANDLATLEGSADLVVRGTLAQPVPYGEVTIEPGGRLVYSATDYTLDRGRILFADPYRLAPEVDLVATTEVRDFDVTLSLSGPLERLDARFSSEPPLPQVEVFRLLAGGDAYVDEADIAPDRSEQIGEEEGTSAATLLYGQAASALGDRVNNLFGFDKFRIDPLTGSRGDNLSKARFTVGKRLSKDVLVTYSVDPSSNDAQRIRVEWQVAEGVILVLSQNGDDSFTADARFESTF